MKSDEIRLSRVTIEVPWEKRAELMRRLEERGLNQIAQDMRTRRELTGTQKPQVLALLNDWLAASTYEELGPELEALRVELDREVKD